MNWWLVWLMPVAPAFLLWLYYDGWWDDLQQIFGHLALAFVPIVNVFMALAMAAMIYDHYQDHGTRGMGLFK